MRISDLRELLHAMGGAKFLHTKHYLIIALLTSPTGSLIGIGLENALVLWLYLLANALSITITAIPFFAIRAAKQSLDLTFGFWQMTLTGAILGGTKTFSMAALVTSFQLEELSDAISLRLPSGVLLGIVIVFIFSALPVLIERFERQRIALIRCYVASHVENAVLPLRAVINQSLENFSKPGHAVEDVTEELHRVSKSSVGQNLVSLWNMAQIEYPSFRSRDLLVVAYRETQIPAVAFLLVIALGSIFRIDYTQLGISGVVAFVLNLAMIYLSILIANQLKARGFAALSLIFITLSTAASLTALSNLIRPAGMGEAMLNFSVAAVFSVIHTLVITVLAAGIKAKLRQEIDFATLNDEATTMHADELARRFAARRAAEILHGQIQSWILAASLRMTQRPETIKAELERLAGQLSSVVDRGAAMTPKQLLTELKRDWEGVVEIELEVRGEARVLESGLVEVIREAVTNSHKHGLSSQVSIRVQFLDGFTQASVSDNGVGPKNGQAGLGRKLMSSIGDWSMRESPQGGSIFSISVQEKTASPTKS